MGTGNHNAGEGGKLTRQDKTFIIKIKLLPVQFLGMQLAENASHGVPN